MKENNEKNRRNFLKAGAALGASIITSTAFGKVSSISGDESTAVPIYKTRMLGEGEAALEVSPIGLGCMSMTSKSYNPVQPKAEMIKVIRGAFDKGITFFDTAEVYGPFNNEEYVGEALKPIRD